MDTAYVFEMLGYSASVLVAISLMMQSVVKLRTINLVGAILFSIYGVMIGAFPVAFLNGFIAVANIYYLHQMYREGTLRPTTD